MAYQTYRFVLTNYDTSLLTYYLKPSSTVRYFICREIGNANSRSLEGFVTFTKGRSRFFASKWFRCSNVFVSEERLARTSIREFKDEELDYFEVGELRPRPPSYRRELESFQACVDGGCTDIELLRESHPILFKRFVHFAYDYIIDSLRASHST